MPQYKPMPPLERLNELFEVVEIPEDKFGEWSGLVRKVSRRGAARAGSVAGNPRQRKDQPDRPDRVDWRVKIDGVSYYASRVIYFMTHGEDPGDIQIDHEDRNPLNNNAWNLRLDTDGEIQAANRGILKNNKSGVTGVSWNKVTEKWQSSVEVRLKMKYLGSFTCKIKAASAVNEKWIELGWDKLGRKLNDLESIECNCESCVRAASYYVSSCGNSSLASSTPPHQNGSPSSDAFGSST